MDIMEIMEQRHSVRQYMEQKIEIEKRNILNELVTELNQESGLHMQIFYDEPDCFDSLMAHYGNFKNVSNYIAIVGNKKDEEKAGYYGEQLILKCQELGINSCWVALTHGKTKAKLAKGEKLLIVISIGYGVNQGVPHKSKPMEELFKADDKPEWFLKGMKAACLAPTAMNQQKFFFELNKGVVTAKALMGFYAKIDLGIVKYHFEVASGHEVQ